jgi:PAS domain S-box-containing protein
MEAVEGGADTVSIAGSSGDISFSVYDLAPAGGWLLVSRVPFDDVAADRMPGAEEMAYRAFFEQAPVGIVHLDEKGIVTFENHALRQIFGESPDDAWLGRHVLQIPVASGFLGPLIETMLSEGTAFDGADIDHVRPGEPTLHLRVLGSPIRNYEGSLAGAVLTVQDVTEARRAEEILEKGRAEAEAASRMKSALIATISHELRTPAGTIHGYASMLEQELRQVGEDALGSSVPLEFADAIRTRAADLVRLVGDLTELSQLETGKVALQVAPVNVEKLLAECVEEITVPATVPVNLSSCDGLFAVADRIRLRRILDQIVGNALKFTSEGHVDIHCSATDRRVRIEVADTGVGIESGTIDQVFEAFHQEDDPMTRRFEGAGVGLAIVRRLVELMDGEVQIDSEKGTGTIVTIYLPRAGAELVGSAG